MRRSYAAILVAVMFCAVLGAAVPAWGQVQGNNIFTGPIMPYASRGSNMLYSFSRYSTGLDRISYDIPERTSRDPFSYSTRATSIYAAGGAGPAARRLGGLVRPVDYRSSSGQMNFRIPNRAQDGTVVPADMGTGENWTRQRRLGEQVTWEQPAGYGGLGYAAAGRTSGSYGLDAAGLRLISLAERRSLGKRAVLEQRRGLSNRGSLYDNAALLDGAMSSRLFR